ncbi:MAG: HD domain-containing protein [Candidatus Gastranaerophilales bacterium]|nr:HD domain-containing protein [Candidatus Gastranaerophilales bacterium]
MDKINNSANTESLKKIKNKSSKKSEDVKGNQQVQKTGDLSEQMAYLGAINRIKINNRAGENVSFRGTAANNEDLTLLSDEEFEKLKEKIEEKLKQNYRLREKIDSSIINPNNILLADKILSDERLYNNTYFMAKAEEIIYDTDTPEKVQAKCDVLDRILSDEILYDNPYFMIEARHIVSSVRSKEGAQIANKIFSDEKFYNNTEFMNYARYIVSNTHTPEQVQSKCDVLDKIFSDERFYNNTDFMKKAVDIVRNTNTPEQAKIADKILSNEGCYNSTKVMDKAGDIVYYVHTPEQVQIADKILSDERLLNTYNFMENAVSIICGTDTPEKAEAKCKVLDKILLSEKLLKNSAFAEEAGNIVRNTDTPEQVQTKCGLIDKILSDEKLFNNPDFMKKAGDIICGTDTPEQAKAKCDVLDKIFSDERLYGNSDFMRKAGNIVDSTNTPEQAQVKCDEFDKVFSDERLYNNPGFMRKAVNLACLVNTKESAQITDKILFDKRLYNNHYFMKEAGNIVLNTKTPEQAQIADKILSDERLFNNPDFIKEAGNIVSSAKTKESAQIADKILSDERLFNNSDFMKKAGDIVSSAYTQYRAQIADKILSDERLFNNPDFIKQAGTILYNTHTPEGAQAKCDVLDKILADERLFNNPDFMKKAGDVVSSIKSKDGAQIINKFLFDEKLFNNRDFMEKTLDVVKRIYYPKQVQIADKILSDERLYNNPDFMRYAGDIVYYTFTPERVLSKCELIDKYLNDKEFCIMPNQFFDLLTKEEEVSYEELKKLNKTIGKDKAAELSTENIILAAKFLPLYNRQDINEIPLSEKRELLRSLVASNADLFRENANMRKLFPMLPKNQEEYCALLPSIVRSIGIETNTLSDEEAKNFNVTLDSLGDILKNISDEEFNNLDIKQEYSKDDFILDTLDKVKDLTRKERQKVYDYFGFELHHNRENTTGYSITGYPVNLNNGKKLAQITDPKTKAVVENLRENVIRFSENNPIQCNNNKVEKCINEVVSALPELRPMIGRTQSKAHDFDCLQHSLKVMKKIVENPEYEKLNDSDKKIMLLASLLHDITKKESNKPDKTHENEGSFDSFYIAKKFNLSKEEEIKLYTLIKNHEWLNKVNTSKNHDELTKNIRSAAYDLRHDNLFDMSLIFTHADLKAVRKDDSFHDTKEGNSRIDFDGNVRSFGESADYYAGMIKECINELKKSQPILPATKLPSSDEIKSKITNVNSDGSTNIKGVYKDKDGLIIIKYNEVEDWEAIGLPEGSISRGITITTDRADTVNTGNIKFIAHGLDYANQLAKFDAFSLPDSNALLSVSYMERPESKYRLFRPQGVLLDVDTKYIHGGGETDSGSGYEKNIQDFKDNYIFGANREKDRLFISNLIKEAAGMNDDEYVQFVEQNQNKSFNEIEPLKLREKLIKAFASINSHKRRGEREYNEMYISNPTPMGGFAYNTDTNETIGNPVDFLNSAKVFERTDFIKQYAIENNLPFVIFGD